MKAYLQIPLTILVIGCGVLLTLTAVVIGGYYYVAPALPRAEQLRDIKMQVPLQVYSRDGRLLAEFGEVKRAPVAYEDIPPRLIDAVLAAEDDRFFEHPGLDYQGIIRAGLNVVATGGGRRVGGSTITQQVARMNFLTRERLYVRKFKEWILALRIEREFSKQEILQLYLNTYFFGQSSYGVSTAARTYFGKELADLTLSEVAIIAGIPQGPSIMNPISSPQRATARRAYELRRIPETCAITQQEYTYSLSEHLETMRYWKQNQIYATYIDEMGRAEMISRF
jgi:penicillin-binding protein 1A